MSALQPFPTIDDNCDGSIIMNFYLHVCLELASCYFQTAGTGLCYELVEERFSLFRRRGVCETGTTPFSGARQ
jgi:hypothetical protein